MKILMTLETSFPPDKRVENEIDSLLSKGYEVHIVCTGRIKQSLKEDLYKKARVHRIFPNLLIRKSSVAALKVPVYFMYWKRKLQKILKKYSFDVVHIHDLPLAKPVYELKKQFGFKIVLDLHENWPGLLSISPHTKSIIGKTLCRIDQWQNYERKYLNIADKIIVVVTEAKQRIMKLGISNDKIAIVSNTMNINDFISPATENKNKYDPKILIYEGGITYHRGIQYVLQAISKIKSASDRIEFRIIGSGSYLTKLKLLSNALVLNKIVKFMGWQDQKNVYENLAKADIAIIPHIKSTHTDTTIPHKLFHYMYVGLPIIASNCNPIKRIIEETSSGYIYEYNNADHLANLIENMITKGITTKINGKEWVQKKYNWQSDSKNLVEAYNDLI